MEGYEKKLKESHEKLLHSCLDVQDVTFIRLFGNRGDDLIYAGTRKLLSGIKYKELSLFHLQSAYGHTAIIAGSGGWCGPYTDLPEFLPIIERRFKKVIVFPSSYDTTINKVREAMVRSEAFFFAREEISYNLIKNICHAGIAHDTAFFYDYHSYQRKGTGQLDAFRTDKEAAGLLIPTDNDDISLTCESLDEWLWKISSYEKVCTDRAHVMIAAALLGKQVDYRSSSYHKVPAIAEFSLKDFPVYQIREDSNGDKIKESGVNDFQILEKNSLVETMNETKKMRRVLKEILTLFSPQDVFILVDGEQVRSELGKNTTAIPFLEKDGKYWGPPQDDDTAIRELEGLRHKGAGYIVITQAAFWWLDYYKEWHKFLRINYGCISENEWLVSFDLRKSINGTVTIK